MIHLLKTVGGAEYEISQQTRDAIAGLLLSGKDERPAFIEIESTGAIIATSSITSIVVLRKEQPVPTGGYIDPSDIEERQRLRDGL